MYQPLEVAVATPRFEQLFHYNAEAVRDELVRGLSAGQAVVEPKFLYDELGSHLFTAITQVPEYYPTRTEARIMRQHAQAIADRVGEVCALIDLGAADCLKAEALFPFLRPRQYVPVDISIDFLRTAVARLHAAYPALDIIALGQDFSQSLSLPHETPEEDRLFFYPGSSIGNWAPAQALAMLRRIREQCEGQGSGLMIGVDRVKSADILVPAYDDALQVTAAFNRNLLLHLNRLLDADFQLEDWHHRAHFNDQHSRIEMHLQACVPVTVHWPGCRRQFDAGETIHTESSYKYHPNDFADMLETAGFRDIAHWTDASAWFSVFHART